MCLLHHVLKQQLRLFRAVCELGETDMPPLQVSAGQRAADLIVIDLFDLHKPFPFNVSIYKETEHVNEKI